MFGNMVQVFTPQTVKSTGIQTMAQRRMQTQRCSNVLSVCVCVHKCVCVSLRVYMSVCMRVCLYAGQTHSNVVWETGWSFCVCNFSFGKNTKEVTSNSIRVKSTDCQFEKKWHKRNWQFDCYPIKSFMILVKFAFHYQSHWCWSLEKDPNSMF